MKSHGSRISLPYNTISLTALLTCGILCLVILSLLNFCKDQEIIYIFVLRSQIYGTGNRSEVRV